MDFSLFNETSEPLDPDPLERALTATLKTQGRDAQIISIIALSADNLRAMKAQHFGLDLYTDTVTFNYNESPDDPLEGEIYISPEIIFENAKMLNTPPAEELLRVVIHGCLHLCGMQDASGAEKSTMTQAEDSILAALEGSGA